MRLRESFSYEHTGVEEVFAIVSDASFRQEALAVAGATDIDVTIEPDGDGHVITSIRRQPAPVPDWVKKFTGDTVEVEQVETWGGPDGAGNRSAEVIVKVIGQPAVMRGTARLIGGDVPELVVEGDVTVRIPLVGKKLEPAFADAIAVTLQGEVELGKQRL